MAGNSGMHFKVEPFDGTGNFTLWQSRVKDILVQQGLAKPLKGKKDGKPEKMTDDDWNDIEERCVSTIRLSISDKIINNVSGETTAVGLWEALEKLYLGKNMTTKLNLKRDLYRLKMEEGGNIIEHMNVFNGLIDQLAKVEVNIEEEDKTLILLTSLPSSYDTLVTTVLYGKATVKMEEVVPALLSQDKRRRSDDRSEHEFAMVGHGGGRFAEKRSSRNSRSRSRDGVKGIRCFKCQEWGHYKKDCPLWKNGEDKSGGSSAAVAVNESDNLGDVLTISKGSTSAQDEWILDSGCTMHVCSKKAYFDKLILKKAGVLTLGDGSTCDVEGVGMVKIKLPHGAAYTLDGVAYAPKMCKNLISLSQLDSQGYGYSAVGGVMKITRGVKVLMKGEKYEGLYRLVASTKCTRVSKVWKVRTREIDREHVSTCLIKLDDGEKGNPTEGEVIRDSSRESTM